MVRYHLALPLLDAEHRGGNGDLHVLLDLDLTSQTPVVLNLFAVEETGFGRQDVAAALQHLTLALSAGTFTATGRGKEYTLRGERVEKR